MGKVVALGPCGHRLLLTFGSSTAMACYCLGVAAGGSGHGMTVWKWKKRIAKVEAHGERHSLSVSLTTFKGAASRKSAAAADCSNNDGDDNDSKKPPADRVTFSSKISTDVPLYEPPGVFFNEYIKDRPRIFRAMFPDKCRGKRLNDEWRIQMLPIRFLFASVSPVVVMRLRCKSHGKKYPPAIPFHVTRILELQATRWELDGLNGISMPSHFALSVHRCLYSVRRGSQSRLKGHLQISISLVLPPALALVPKDVLKGMAESVLTRLVEKMKQEVDAGLLSDFGNFGREKLMKHSQTTLPPAATTTTSLEEDPHTN